MDPRIAKTLDYIESNLNSPLALEELAEVACLSTSQFHRIFKRETDRTPFIFIEEMKMAKAYELMSEGKVMIHEMANLLGYKDYETFSRAFKKHFLLSPDDLKAISLKLKDEVGEDQEIILTVAESEEEALEQVEKIIEEKGLCIDKIEDSLKFFVREKTSESSPEKLIKNKYELASGQKIWESLLNRNR